MGRSNPPVSRQGTAKKKPARKRLEAVSLSVIAGLDPRLSGSILVDKAHGVDSSVFQAFGDVLGHGEGSSHAASE
jgi:hypothetical protein